MRRWELPDRPQAGRLNLRTGAWVWRGGVVETASVTLWSLPIPHGGCSVQEFLEHASVVPVWGVPEGEARSHGRRSRREIAFT